MSGNTAAAPGISIDSRTLRPGDVYYALRGDSHDGHDFVEAALAAGAAAVPEVAPLRPPVRHATGSTAFACGTRGNISTRCGRWSKVR